MRESILDHALDPILDPMDRTWGKEAALSLRLYGTPGPLLGAVARTLSIEPGNATVGAHADTERHVAIRDDLYGRTAILLVSTGPPVDANTLALALLADAARRAGARAVVAVTPYLGYARGDRIAEPGDPVACRVVADLLQASGVTHLIAVDLHNPAITGFFHIPVVEISAVPLLASAFPRGSGRVVVAPDAGAIGRARRLAALLECPIAVAVKRRTAAGAPRILDLLGDVAGREALVVDDMVSTGETVREVVLAIRERGGIAIDLAATHAVMVGEAERTLRTLEASGLRRVVFTDTLAYQPTSPWPALSILSVAPLLAEAVATVVAPARPAGTPGDGS